MASDLSYIALLVRWQIDFCRFVLDVQFSCNHILIVSSRAVSRRALSRCLCRQVCQHQKRQSPRSGPPVSSIDLSRRLPGEPICAVIGWFHLVYWHCAIVRSFRICRGNWKQEVASRPGRSVRRIREAFRSCCVARALRPFVVPRVLRPTRVPPGLL